MKQGSGTISSLENSFELYLGILPSHFKADRLRLVGVLKGEAIRGDSSLQHLKRVTVSNCHTANDPQFILAAYVYLLPLSCCDWILRKVTASNRYVSLQPKSVLMKPPVCSYRRRCQQKIILQILLESHCTVQSQP